jgi:putative membrane protein
VPDTRFAAVTCGFTSWLDPATSTIHHAWIWENGGGFFGVPLVNFLGWTFTVYLFMQVFALCLRGRGPVPAAQPDRATAGDLQAVLLYAATTFSFFATFFTGARTTVTDAVGTTWHTGDIYETSVLLTVYGMCFIALLALLRIAQRRTIATALAAPANIVAEANTAAESNIVQRAQPDPVRPSA